MIKPSISKLVKEAHETAAEKGWWNDKESKNKAELIALMHSELSEALEALRKPGKRDDHLPDEDAVGLELADTVIRIFDYCGAYNIDLEDIIIKKMTYNRNRSYKHGGKTF